MTGWLKNRQGGKSGDLCRRAHSPSGAGAQSYPQIVWIRNFP
jgi:hypothetical protein